MGLQVPSDAKGCLQAMHWSLITYGYFPTYLIGAATAAQLEHFGKTDISDVEDKIEKGEFGEIKGFAWLTAKKVHKEYGKRYKTIWNRSWVKAKPKVLCSVFDRQVHVALQMLGRRISTPVWPASPLPLPLELNE
jgi:hypothetical protein